MHAPVRLPGHPQQKKKPTSHSAMPGHGAGLESDLNHIWLNVNIRFADANVFFLTVFGENADMTAIMAKAESGFGERLRKLRKAAGMTYRELAAASGLNVGTVTKIEYGA